MLTIAICDDSPIQLESVHRMIKDLMVRENAEHSILCYSEAERLLDYLSATDGMADIVFLDIKLPNQSGIEIAKTVNMLYPRIKIIFMTAHITYARDIFDASPTYFLLKPLSQQKLEAALEAAISAVNNEIDRTISISSKGQLYKLRLNLIEYAMSSGRIVTFFEEGRKIVIYTKMDDVVPKMGASFLRCHQSYLVNMDRIMSFDKLSLVLYSGVTIPVSKNRHTQAKATYLKYLGGSL
ncbi:MAG: response regulator transcription factor [Clostridiales bacterium]|jgi:DNA-binding LytR/AlgR family response regulator|nr:response regulator transcription factor [Clostridiales bacterium]